MSSINRPNDISSFWEKIKNRLRRMFGKPHYIIYKEDDGTRTALLIVPVKKSSRK